MSLDRAHIESLGREALIELVLTLTARIEELERGGKRQAYKQLRQQIATRERVHADDAGWRIAGIQAWLMGFTSTQETVYQIRGHHDNQEVREVIDESYRGVLHTDRFRSYDAKELLNVRQQKSMAHVQRNLSDLIEQQCSRARTAWRGDRTQGLALLESRRRSPRARELRKRGCNARKAWCNEPRCCTRRCACNRRRS